MAKRRTIEQDPSLGEGTQDTGTATAEMVSHPVDHSQEPTREVGDEELPGKKWTPEVNPRPWVNDNVAGIEYRTARDPYQCEIVFAEGKPSDAVRQHLKDNGFKWNPDYTAWTHPIGFTTQAQDKLHGRKVSHEVIDMVRAEKGLPPSRGADQPDF